MISLVSPNSQNGKKQGQKGNHRSTRDFNNHSNIVESGLVVKSIKLQFLVRPIQR